MGADTARASAPPPERDPHATYLHRLQTLQAREQALQREHLRLGYLRLAFALAVIVLLFPPVPVALLPFAAFVFAARVHQATLRQLAETRRSLAFFQHGIARLEDRWAGLQPRTTRLDLSTSLYAADLDLFGPASLFELLCEARTTLGEDTLARWLLTPSSVAELRARQEAVAELRTRLPLREAFAAVPGPALAPIDRNALGLWAQMPGKALPGTLRWLAPLLVLLTTAAAARFALTHSPLLLLATLVVDASLTFGLQRRFKPLFAGAEQTSRSLRTAAWLLAQCERPTFAAPRSQELQARLRFASSSRSQGSASQALARLARRAVWIEARGNYVVRLLDAPLLFSVQLALAVQAWRTRFASALPEWLDTLGEFEALLSLAGYSFEHPDDPFPELTESDPSFTATGLGHPLLPSQGCVRNDLALGPATRLLLVSGSNMSGKSTLLRAVGVSAVMAMAGAPVRAQRLTLSPFAVAASIQVQDSLQAGRSRFFAEILRLRAITEAAAGPLPVLFLLDELLAGTNSSDRLAGAEGLLHDLLRKNALGLLSTHDLALTALASEHGSLVHNVHFQDEILNGELRFDYTLREGTVERSNGLALMRLIGLDV